MTTELLSRVADWSLVTLLMTAVVFGFLPKLAMHILTLIYPKNHARRAELRAELEVVPHRKRLLWVAEQVATVLFDGVPARVRDLQMRRQGRKIDRRRTDAAQNALFAPSIAETRRTLEAISAEYRSLNKEFFPTDVFEATAAPDPVFTRILMADFNATGQYFFRGFSGRHAAARLFSDRTDRKIRVVIADPRRPNSVSGRVRRLSHHRMNEQYDQIQKTLVEEIHVGLVGLFLARSRCTRVEITATADPPLDRLEMFDNSVWLGLYSEPGDATELYPRTLRFGRDSYLYKLERTEFSRLWTSRQGRHFSMGSTTTYKDFIALFEVITGSPLSENRFRELKSKFDAFREESSAH
ncbi:hypothetical protein [Amycolatopsis sp. lyj-346]|uniref:hypothetical protein n=1 Tax=Amycolatopsis sp. lyj-346 TaxID=2789289 RepID=UPI003979DF0C